MFHSVAAGTAGPGNETLPASDVDSTAIIKRGRKKHAHTHTHHCPISLAAACLHQRGEHTGPFTVMSLS